MEAVIETEESGCQSLRKKVLAVIPCLNEEAHLEAIVRGLLTENAELDMRVVIADGGSTDGSVAIAKRLATSYSNVIYFHNEKKIQSAGLNRAATLYGGDCDYLLRVDAHCGYPEGYCRSLLKAQKESGAASVVVSMIAAADSHCCFQRAAATAQNSLLGNGGSAHRSAGKGRYTDHGHHALMTLPAFFCVGGYDECFTHNEDAELDVRLKQAGYMIWLMADSPIVYFPRAAARSLLRQYFNYGHGRAKMVLKHRLHLKLRQALPLAVGPAVMLLLLGFIQPIIAIPGLSWAALCLSYGAVLGVQCKRFCSVASGVAAMIMHFGWSLGFISEVFCHLLFRKVSGNQVAPSIANAQ